MSKSDDFFPTSLFDLIPKKVAAWKEVPQPLFLSWSKDRQYSYCAARDDYSASQALSLDEAAWYRDRAAGYRSLIGKE